MLIRKAETVDILKLVGIDRTAYGDYGADEKYFTQKISAHNTHILVVQEGEVVTGFSVFEVLEKNQIPPDFINLKLDSPLEGEWAHIIAFTTKTNYLDTVADSMLLQSIEALAKSSGCFIFGVPLSIDHPFARHDVFNFWERNNYLRAGTIDWKAGVGELIPCYFYRKIDAGTH